MQKQHKLEN